MADITFSCVKYVSVLWSLLWKTDFIKKIERYLFYYRKGNSGLNWNTRAQFLSHLQLTSSTVLPLIYKDWIFIASIIITQITLMGTQYGCGKPSLLHFHQIYRFCWNIYHFTVQFSSVSEMSTILFLSLKKINYYKMSANQLPTKSTGILSEMWVKDQAHYLKNFLFQWYLIT